MARRSVWRWLATVSLVLATSLGLVVSTAGTSQALNVDSPFQWSPSQGLTLSAPASGAVKAMSPYARKGLARCAVPTQACVAIAGATAVAVAAGIGCAATEECREVVVPWFQSVTGTDRQSEGGTTGCGSSSWDLPDPLAFSQEVPRAWGNIITIKHTLGSGGASGICYTKHDLTYECRSAAGTIKTGLTSNNQSLTTSNPVRIASHNLNNCSSPGDRLIKVQVLHSDHSAGGNTWRSGPDRLWEAGPTTLAAATNVECQRPDGSTYTTSVQTPDAKEALRIAQCEPGDVATGLDVTTSTNLGAGPVTTISFGPHPEDGAQYPLCAGAACDYWVVVDGRACAAGVAGCSYWTKIATEAPARVECHYGPYVLPWAECGFLERAYEGSPRVVTEPNTDGNPQTWTNPEPPAAPEPSPTGSPSPSPSPTGSPSPTPTYSAPPSPDDCVSASRYNLGPVMPQTAAFVGFVAPRFNVATVYGYREDPIPDHPSGLAADFMVGTDAVKGGYVAEYARANAQSLGVRYVIWNQKIWSMDRAAEGWRAMADRGSLTANHKDHVHVTMHKAPAFTAPCEVSPPEVDNPQQSQQCFPSGWGGLINPGDFVVMPLKCLFIPRKDLGTRVGVVVDEISGKGPMAIVDSVGDVITGVDDGAGGCLGPAMTFKVTSNGQTVEKLLRPFAACADPMKTVASYTYALSTVVIVVGGAFACARGVAMGFGFGFSMGKGGKDE